MDIRQLFEDFKNHVESLDDATIRQSIANAVEHSSNGSSLECNVEKENYYNTIQSEKQNIDYLKRGIL